MTTNNTACRCNLFLQFFSIVLIIFIAEVAAAVVALAYSSFVSPSPATRLIRLTLLFPLALSFSAFFYPLFLFISMSLSQN